MSKWVLINQDTNRNFFYFEWVAFGVQRGEDVFCERLGKIEYIESVFGDKKKPKIFKFNDLDKKLRQGK